ncbi:hypothetical protein AB0J42_13150 [Nonomuraea sp. NPDC049649]|uniref:RNA polymerase sigma factor n=1 Tax=Nonomuraea sp. NPDC049649 TaxID=3155776 RepID=UPI0034477690
MRRLSPPSDPETLDDAEVIARSRDDPERFAVLFTRHAPVLKRYVVRRLGAEAAEDIVAETFTAAFRQRARRHPCALASLNGPTAAAVRCPRRSRIFSSGLGAVGPEP